ncbi:hypothetical protein ACQEWB_27665 [Streptomyces sp. CA-249302]|uniref:hypothetical protein n=1 Tax=Streptomyces sp. CA-249302 TaxID=3240058 RepID=UPI003D8DB8ED
METALFGRGLYDGGDDLADRLRADIELIPALRRSWSPDLADRLHDPLSPVGRYDTPIRGLVLAENSARAQALHTELADTVPLATGAPPRLGLGSPHEPLLTVFDKFFRVPSTELWRGVAEQLYGFSWCLTDQTRLCPECVHGSAVCCMYGAPIDYHHFAAEVSGITGDSCRAMAAYIEHVHRDHGPRSRERAVMDSWLACLQALYLDVLHPKAARIAAGDDKRRSLRYRSVNSAGRALALLTSLERPGGAFGQRLVEATGIAGMALHDACDRRHDNAAHESHNFFTLLAVHDRAESLAPLRRFCVDLWAWAVDHDLLWPVLLAGRTLLWQAYVTRYQTPLLLDHLAPPSGIVPSDPYADAVLNRMSPAPRAVHPDDCSVRGTCRDKSAYDRLLDVCLKHFAECAGCHGYERAGWQERTAHLDRGYGRKAAGDPVCVDRMAVFTVLAQLERVWWAADPTVPYKGPTGRWDPYLV